MSSNRRSALLASGLFVCISIDLYCLSRAIPLGLAGSPERNKWFALFFVGISLSIILSLIYYLRPDEAERMVDPHEAEMRMLNEYGKQLAAKGQKDKKTPE